MVSIPDFSRWGRMGQTGRVESPLQRYEKHREMEALRLAQESGYFLPVTQGLLINAFSDTTDNEEKKQVDIRQIQCIRLPISRVRNIGAIEFCHQLAVLVLPNNYLTNIDSLIPCRQLIKLDLKGNQIQTLPGIAFWGCLRQLRVLYLHGNPIGRTDAIIGLSGVKNLGVLTLYDTPLSLKKNYRHHVVNSIWTLKALDQYVVSDEEIIEDARFPGNRFHPFDPAFKICLYRLLPKKSNLEAEICSVLDLMFEISCILAHNSPVLIIQRYFRGHLARQRLRVVHDRRKGAVVVIQRWWRDLKGIPQINVTRQPPPTPVQLPDTRQTSMVIDVKSTIPEERPDDGSEKPPPPSPKKDQDQDKTATPPKGEREISIDSVMKKPVSASTIHKGPTHKADLVSYSKSPEGGSGVRQVLRIDLNQLESQTTLEALDAEARALEGVGVTAPFTSPTAEYRAPLASPRMRRFMGKLATSQSSSKYRIPPGTRVKDHRLFFGPIVPVCRSPEPSVDESDEEIPMTAFRLRGDPAEIQELDPVVEMILRRAEMGRAVREAEEDYHRARLQDQAPQLPPKAPTSKTNDQKLFSRVQGTMGVLLLQKWDRMDRDIRAQEASAARMETVLATRDAKARAKQGIHSWQEDRRLQALANHRREKREDQRAIEKRKLKEQQEREQERWRRERKQQLRNGNQQGIGFATEFRGQHNSVSKALLRHDRNALTEDKLQARAELVNQCRDNEKEQLEAIRKYLEHQKMMRQAEIAIQRATVDGLILQEVNQHLLESHARVDRLKSLRRQAMLLQPTTAKLPAVPTLKQEDFKGLDRFGVQILTTAGRVGQHPVL